MQNVKSNQHKYSIAQWCLQPLLLQERSQSVKSNKQKYMVFHNNNHINPFTANKFSIWVKLPAKSSPEKWD